MPPLALAQELYGEAHGQAAAGDSVSELAVGAAIRNRFGDSVYFNGFNYWQSMKSTRFRHEFNGLDICGAGCPTPGNDTTEATNAAVIFAGISVPAAEVDNSKCFFSPKSSDWQKISQALQSGTTTFPQGLSTNAASCWSVANRQIVYKESVGNNATCTSCAGAPAFLFLQWRLSSEPAVAGIP